MKRSIAAGTAATLGAMLLVALTSTRSIGDGDASPRACVDCHTGDKKLSLKLAAWTEKVDGPMAAHVKAVTPPTVKLKGKHPKLPFGKAIPKSCMGCHAANSKVGPPMGPLMHLVHRTGGQNVDCTACHKLDTATGKAGIPSADE